MEISYLISIVSAVIGVALGFVLGVIFSIHVEYRRAQRKPEVSEYLDDTLKVYVGKGSVEQNDPDGVFGKKEKR